LIKVGKPKKQKKSDFDAKNVQKIKVNLMIASIGFLTSTNRPYIKIEDKF